LFDAVSVDVAKIIKVVSKKTIPLIRDMSTYSFFIFMLQRTAPITKNIEEAIENI
jgi:hypothetical protein